MPWYEPHRVRGVTAHPKLLFMMKSMNYAPSDLFAFADQLLQTAGLPPDKAQAVADVLLEGDLLGHTTHGLALLAPYLAELESGKMRKEGQPLVV